MKKTACFILAAAFLAGCGPSPREVERSTEGEVEIVQNHLKPYHLEGEPGSLQLERLFSIDTEDQAVIEAGLLDMEDFDVDAQGNIFIIRWQSRENFIFKFDARGAFVTSFAARGEEPGQFLFGGTIQVWGDSTLMAKDPGLTQFQLFSLEGEFIREMQTQQRFAIDQMLRNGNFLIRWQDENMAEKKRVDHVGLANVLYERSTEIDAFAWTPLEVASRFLVPRGDMVSRASQDFVFVAHPDREYEIRVFDLQGSLVRMIRKEYMPVKVTAQHRASFLNQYPEDSRARQRIVFRASWPPCRYLITDDEGRLYIMTHEKGENPNEAVYDVFNSEGIFIARTSIGNKGAQNPLPAKMRGRRLYCMTEKEGGHRELIIYETTWR
ncbi:MAG: hypothetical protein ACERK6_01590 [Candidatus Aminicenantaceae bacterium]